jgi:DNA-directed RNA polymerase subunit RPC12/RpoP
MEQFREVIRCPKCNSEMIETNQKGFGAGKALVGAVATGGIGLFAGFIGSKKIVAVCLACGKKFDPKEGYLKIRINDNIAEIPFYDQTKESAKQKRIETISNLSDGDMIKKFKIWDRLYEKGLLTKSELEQKKKEYVDLQK